VNRFSITVDIPAAPDRWRIVELAEGRRFTWVTGSPGVRAVAEHAVERYLGLEATGLRERSVAPGWHRA
jgi:hypothetical protein